MRPVVFIHTNDKQIVGAKVAEYALKSKSRSPDDFDVRIIRLEETPRLYSKEGQTYLRKGKDAIWHNNDLQSFSPLRMMVPQLMNFEGKAILIDPDIFAVADVCELLNQDMNGNAIICRNISDGYRGNGNSFYATSVMLLDCAKLKHWQWDKQIEDMFAKRLDYGDWISLKLEDPSTIGLLNEEWNHFDTLNDTTKLLHNTERSTQPWKTGLPVDYDTNISRKFGLAEVAKWFTQFTKKACSESSNVYQPHPDKRQEQLFVELLKASLNKGVLTRELLEAQVAAKNVRSDIFMLLEKV